jgi:Glycosyltransferase 61
MVSISKNGILATGRNLFSWFTRIGAKIEREFRRVTFFSAAGVSSFLGDEVRATLSFTRVAEYSPATSYIANDIFDDFQEIHGFRQRFTYKIDRATIDTKLGLIFDTNNNIVQESSSWPSGHLIGAAITKPRKIFTKDLQSFNKKILLPSNGFYHWLLEDLPSFLGSMQYSENSEIIHYEKAPSYVKEFAKLLNTKITQVPQFVSANNLIVTSKTHDTGWVHPKDVTILRNFFSESIENMIYGRKIYISRLNSSRSPVWEKTLQDKLSAEGWEILFLEEMELKDQIKKVSTAEILCGVHGAGLSHAVWLTKDSKLIELSPNEYRNCFSNLSQVCKLKYEIIPISVGENEVLRQLI